MGYWYEGADALIKSHILDMWSDELFLLLASSHNKFCTNFPAQNYLLVFALITIIVW